MRMKRVAINGFGRIGRLVFRIMEDDPEIEIVAINDLTDAKQLAHLLKYDTSHGNYKIDSISYENDEIIVGDRRIKVYAEKEPRNLPWKDLNIDVVFECTGLFTSDEKASHFPRVRCLTPQSPQLHDSVIISHTDNVPSFWHSG